MSGFKNSENFSARYYDFKPGHLLEKAAMSNAISNLIAYAEEPLARWPPVPRHELLLCAITIVNISWKEVVLKWFLKQGQNIPKHVVTTWFDDKEKLLSEFQG